MLTFGRSLANRWEDSQVLIGMLKGPRVIVFPAEYRAAALCTVQVSSKKQHWPSTPCAALVLLRACLSDICRFPPSAPADIMYTCLDSDVYLPELGATFTAALFLIPVCDSHSVTHCQAASLYNLL